MNETDKTGKRRRPLIALGLAAVVHAIGPTTVTATDHYAKEASELLSTARTFDDINKVIRENPGNPVLKILGAITPIQQETGRKVQQLFAEIEDKDVPRVEAIPTADLAFLRRIDAALQRTKANVASAGRQLDRLYEDQLKRVSETLRTFGNERRAGPSVTNFDKVRENEIDTLKRFLSAHSDLYGAIHDLVLFLIRANGGYSYDPNARGLVFQNKDRSATYNKLVDRIVAAGQHYESVQNEVARLSEFRPPTRH